MSSFLEASSEIASSNWHEQGDDLLVVLQQGKRQPVAGPITLVASALAGSDNDAIESFGNLPANASVITAWVQFSSFYDLGTGPAVLSLSLIVDEVQIGTATIETDGTATEIKGWAAASFAGTFLAGQEVRVRYHVNDTGNKLNACSIAGGYVEHFPAFSIVVNNFNGPTTIVQGCCREAE